MFEEPVEGGITRFIAVYQCQTAARIEPVRSARFVDADILQPLGKVLFAYSGAIQPVVDDIDSPASLLEDVGGRQGEPGPTPSTSPGSRRTTWRLRRPRSTRRPKHSATHENSCRRLISRTAALPAGGKQVSAVHIDFPLDVTTWTWDAQNGALVALVLRHGPGRPGRQRA